MPARRYSKRKYSYRRKYKRKTLKKIKKTFRLISISLLGLVLFSIAFYLFTLTQNLRKPFAYASNGVRLGNTVYNSSFSYSILAVDLENKDNLYSTIENLYIYRIEPTEDKALLLKIPVDTKVEYPTGSDEKIKISSLYSKGNIQDEGRGIVLVTDFIKSNMAISIDSYIIYDKNAKQELKKMGIEVKSNTLNTSIKYSHFLKVKQIFNLSRKYVSSDLGSIEVVKILSDTKNISFVNYEFLELSEKYVFDNKEFDSLWQDKTSNTSLERERLTVTILNSTSTPGLAGWGARVVKNAKGAILEVGNNSENETKNTIYTNSIDSKTVKYLSDFYEVDQILLSSDFKNDQFLAKRSDIILVLGEKAASIY